MQGCLGFDADVARLVRLRDCFFIPIEAKESQMDSMYPQAGSW
jgi:hypothetical protein